MYIILVYTVTITVMALLTLNSGSRFWRTTKIIRAVSEADYNRLNRQPKDQPGPSHKIYTLPSDSDSDDLQCLGRKRKRPLARYEFSTDSDSSLPHVKVSAPLSDSPTVKMLSEIKSLLSNYHSEIVHLRLERELEEKKPTLYSMFACLICKDVVVEESAPLVPPCCRAAVLCRECMDHWLENQPSCPHCREPLTIERCDKLPILRPLFDFLSEQEN